MENKYEILLHDNVIVTGGAGFIGSNLTERLVKIKEKSYEITVIDNLHTGHLDNIKSFKDHIKFINANSGIVKNLNTNAKIIFHLGIYSSSPMYKENPQLMSMALNDFINILEFARKNDAKIIFSSSSSIYNSLKPPHNEDMQIIPTDYYTEVRYYMERLSDLYHKLYGLNIIGLRFFSVYGPKEKFKKKYANLISQFLWAIMQDKEIIIYGDGSQKRDFIYVDDVVNACILALNKNVNSGIFNVGTGKSYSVNEMLQKLEKLTKKKAKVKYVENKIKNYVYETLADTKKAEKELNFKAEISLEEGIKNLIAYYAGEGI
ncbi:MAG: NAD-dependent epimerase/dehydratase family protein [Candidatus Anstonellales archaeon]